MPNHSDKQFKLWRLSRKQAIITLVVLTIIVAAALLGLIIGRWQAQQQPEHKAEITGQLDNPFPSEVTKAENLQSQGKYEEANKVINETLPSADDKTKYELYLQQGLNFEKQKQFDKALEAYGNAEALQQTFGIYESMGRVAETMGNKALAIQNYKKALERLDPNYPVAAADRRILEEKIKKLGG